MVGSMMFRARLSSFLAGFAVASGFAIYQLRSDVRDSHKLLAEQAEGDWAKTRGQATSGDERRASGRLTVGQVRGVRSKLRQGRRGDASGRGLVTSGCCEAQPEIGGRSQDGWFYDVQSSTELLSGRVCRRERFRHLSIEERRAG
uniref:Uncharacterized protein n=1 Tax=Chloropicon laureae TaxID=464258 RepID=A0A7S2Z8H9_9CHLO